MSASPQNVLGVQCCFRTRAFLTIVALAVLVSGCPLEDLQGPDTVEPGGQATFTMTMRYDGTGSEVGQPFIVAEIPDTWTFESLSFDGTSLGNPVSGTGHLVTFDYSGCAASTWPPLREGYRRIFITEKSHPIGQGDTADISITFHVGQDVGEKTLRFWAMAYYECKYEPAEIDVAVRSRPIPATTRLGLLTLLGGILTGGLLAIRRTW